SLVRTTRRARRYQGFGGGAARQPPDVRATSSMIAASSCGRDHIGQWLVGRSTHVTLRSSANPPSQVWPCSTASLYWSDVYPVAMAVVGIWGRAAFVSSGPPRNSPAGPGTP